MILVAINQTVSALAISQLPLPGQEIPAGIGATVTLTDYATVTEIQDDAELLAHVTAGDCLIQVNGVTLSASESEAALGTVVLIPPVFGDYYDAGTMTIGSSATTLDLDTARQSNAAFVLAANTVTVQSGADGDYLVSYSVTGNESDSSNRAIEVWLEIGGSEVPASRGEILHWDEHGLTGDGTAGRSMVLTLSAGDVLRLRGEVTTGSSGYDTATGGVSLQITTIGSNGPPGATGATGASGSGSNINVEQDSVLVGGGPFSVINFEGITATDGGGGTCDVSAGANIAQYIRSTAQTIATSPTTIALDSTSFEDSAFSRTGSDVSINTAGIVRVSYVANFDTTANARRTQSTWCELDTGGGFAEITPSRSASYTRNNTDDESSNGAAFFVSVGVGDNVRMVCQSTGTSGTFEAQANRVWITFEYMRP